MFTHTQEAESSIGSELEPYGRALWLATLRERYNLGATEAIIRYRIKHHLEQKIANRRVSVAVKLRKVKQGLQKNNSNCHAMPD